MLISKLIKVVEEKQFEVELPYYSKSGSFYFCIIDENTVIQASKHSLGNYGDINLNEAANGEAITENEFLAMYATARANTSFSLPQTTV